MPIERDANDAQTTLAAPCGALDSIITVVNPFGFPASGNFRIRVDNEIMLVTAVTPIVGPSTMANFSVARAVEPVQGIQVQGTHSLGSVVDQVLTAAALSAIIVQVAGGSIIGSPIGGAVPFGILFADASSNLAQNPGFTFNPSASFSVSGVPIIANGSLFVPSSVSFFGVALATQQSGDVATALAIFGLVVSGTYDASKLTGGIASSLIAGTATNDDAPSGNIGEYFSTSLDSGSGVNLNSGTITDVMGITLPAGDWDVGGNLNIALSLATATQLIATLTDTSASLPNDGSEAYSGYPGPGVFASNVDSITLKPKRYKLVSATTIYLDGLVQLSSGTATGFGTITARRAR